VISVAENMPDPQTLGPAPSESVSISGDKSTAVSMERPTRRITNCAGKGNQRARKHGLYAHDVSRVDMRKREDKAVFAALRAIEDDLADLSAAKRLILDGIGRKLRDLFKLDAWIETLESIVNKRKRALVPGVVEKHRLLESIRRDLEALCLERCAKLPPSIHEYMAQHDAAKNAAVKLEEPNPVEQQT
jgi:hypothetical protein